MNPIAQATSIATAQHYQWGEVCDGRHLLKEADLSVIQERVPAGAGEARHYHSRARQFFYILSGEARMEFDDQALPLCAGQGVHVPPGVVHRFANQSDAEVVFLVISSPSTAGDRTNLAA
ncbi:cupin domain-containing protein [Chitinimonas sp.]|uniref:cupin domain-containing protein n=1 Tax=Chitinimonas sp. TaxID=1934313 RepID=UPI0035B2EC3B